MRSIGEECIRDDDLRNLLAKKPNPTCYDGFEPSGRMHIAQVSRKIFERFIWKGILKSINVNKCTKAGCTFIFWVADWFAMLNNKMGGDLKKIRVVGEYMIEVWKACGMDMNNVKFIWSSGKLFRSSLTFRGDQRQSQRILAPRDGHRHQIQVAACYSVLDPKFSSNRQLLHHHGSRERKRTFLFSNLLPLHAMRWHFLFEGKKSPPIHFKADICQLGMDQRKVNMLAREYCDLVKPKIKLKPIILSHRNSFCDM